MKRKALFNLFLSASLLIIGLQIPPMMMAQDHTPNLNDSNWTAESGDVGNLLLAI